MAVTNTNKMMLDRPVWEQLSFAPAAGIAGTNIVDDGDRFIYSYFQTSSTTAQFWRYDTWGDTWQMLSSPPTVTGTIANMVYSKSSGKVFSGQVFGTIWLFVGNAVTTNFYKYDISTNAWSTMSIANIPATFGTDCYLMYPDVPGNNYSTAYHSGVTRTITTSAVAAVGATSIAVTALPEALAADTILRFGTFDITVGTTAIKGATTLSVSGVTQGLATGSIIKTYDGTEVCLSAAAASGAVTLTIQPLSRTIQASTKIKIEQFAILTAAAAAAAVSITVSPLFVGIASASTAGYYGNMYLIGNASTTMYRYNISTNTWSTTSANSGNPVMAAVQGAVGVGNALKWLPAYNADHLWCLRGNGTPHVYFYNLVSNTWTAETYYPNTETFSTGTSVASRDIGGKRATLLIQKDSTGRIFEGIPYKNSLEPKMTQWLLPIGTATTGDRSCVITSPDGIDFYYTLISSSTGFVRCAIIDS